MSGNFTILCKNFVCVYVCMLSCFSCVQLCNPWTIACQPPLPMGFSKQEHWTELPCPPLEDLPDPGIKPRSLASQADSLPSEPPQAHSTGGKTKACSGM